MIIVAESSGYFLTAVVESKARIFDHRRLESESNETRNMERQFT
jgi:hypothetical protein